FCQDKIMTTGGEGGMVTTNDWALWSAMWSFKDHGKSWAAVYQREHPPGFRWLHESFGTNWRMIEVQAAIGRIQLRRMAEWHVVRLANARKIWQVADRLVGLRAPQPGEGVVHAAYKCYVFAEPQRLSAGWSRDRIIQEVVAAGVPCYAGSCSEIYLEKAFEGTGWRPRERLAVARELGETSLMFLVHPTLSADEIEKTCSVLQAVMARAVH
ncbi:MAG TPA: DegT/DnrJ/EryC1/StrS family aminotransferase, partial [Azonexus sp.]|nr:DegT/DnrJ/EryC1/StrS family aminotransferase [Azonexus sp.]